ncbi:MAG: histidine phosphatase family protein [Gemmatimonadales bacterium]|nr:histidine phosphatase family protein [Gemmatimonadales bacterium]
MDEVVARAGAELARIASEYPAGLVAAVSHGDVIRALLAHYAGMPLDLMLRLEVAPASVSAVRLAPEPLVMAVNWRTDGIGSLDLRIRRS